MEGLLKNYVQQNAGKNMENKIAIIIPVINCLEYTRRLLNSLPWEEKYQTIIIDNGSDDDTLNYFFKNSRDLEIDYLRYESNNGVAKSWNLGIKYAIREYDSQEFIILNNDIVLHPLCINNMLEAVRMAGIGLSSGYDISGRLCSWENIKSYKIIEEKKMIDAPQFSCFAITKKTIDTIGFFDEKFYPAYFEDNDYHYRLKLNNLRGVSNPTAYYYHFGSRTIRENEKVKIISNTGYNINKDYYFQKWGGEPGEEKYKIAFNIG